MPTISVPAVGADRFERFAQADLQRAVVRRARTEEDWTTVERLRRDGFSRVRGVRRDGQWLDDLDRSPCTHSLIGYTLEGEPIVTLRVQDGRMGPLELSQFVRIDRVLKPSEEPAAQFGRLSVVRSPERVHVMFGVFKAAWKWCFDQGLATIVIASPSWAQPIYDFMHFEGSGPEGQFAHRFARGAIHQTSKLPVQQAERIWRSHGQPLSDQFFGMEHPNIES